MKGMRTMDDSNQKNSTDRENADANSGNVNNPEGNANSNKKSEAVWSGDTYHTGHIHSDSYSPNEEDVGGSSTQWHDQNSNDSSAPYNAAQQEPVWHQNTWQPPQYQDPGQKKMYREKKRHDRKGSHMWSRILAGIVGCFVISACSIGIFVALVNNGVIHFGNSSSGGSAFAITKLIDNSSGSAASTSSGTSKGKLLTKQQVCQKVIPSVVLVQNYQNVSNEFDFSGTGTNDSDNSYNNTSLFGNDNGQNGSSNRKNGGTSSNSSDGISPSGEGSGVIISSDGYIMTNAHVVDGASALKVVLSSGKSYEAKLIGSDEVTDLALIKINATGLAAAEFGDSSSLKIGDEIVAIGNPGGSELASSATFGNISALNRTITDSDTGYTRQCIQTDAAINPGNSGGALVNMYGQVIGINSSKLTQVGGTSAEGLGFAIPINDAQPIISSLKQYGYVKDRAVLGISGRMVDSVSARIYGLSTTGFVIQKITNSALTKAGVTVGDMITKIDGTSVISSGTITSAVTKKKAGDTVKLTLYSLQTGHSKEVTVKLIAQTGKSSS
ncbi:MAG TPA: trypsin [Ruminococcaceae bacterium]|jgi:serine protease Do|nr:trypsin [Oscillospiraceae bacterium]HCM23012.1 trypsin [Oscillospiraceae bacterium]